MNRELKKAGFVLDGDYNSPHCDFVTPTRFYVIVAQKCGKSGYVVDVHYSFHRTRDNYSMHMGYFSNARYVAEFALLMKTKEL